MNIREYVAAREASHASLAALLGLRVLSLRIAPLHRDDPYEGNAMVMYPVCPRGWHKRMQVTLAPLLEQGDWPTWPLNPFASRTDERILHGLAGLLELDVWGYHRIIADTLELLETARYKRLHLAMSYIALKRGPVLDEAMLDLLIEEFAYA